MKIYVRLLAALFLFSTALAFAGFVPADTKEQDSGVTPPPKVLVIYNEILKPGQTGSAHLKAERGFVDAYAAAKWPEHYLAMDALSGRERTIFFAGYDCLDSWQKDMDATEKDPTLSAALDAARAADGALLESHESSAYVYRDDLSVRAPADISHMRYMDITIFHVRQGHKKDFEALAKMYMNAAQKMPKANWATFEKVYGVDSGRQLIVITPRKSLAEVDQDMADEKNFTAALGGPEDMKKIRELTAAAIESSDSHLFQMNPKMSYVSDAWAKADPQFWDQK